MKSTLACIVALWLGLLARPHTALAAIPEISAPTVDLARVLSADQRAAVDRDLFALREATGVQMAVLIVSSLEGRPIEDFAHEVFGRWGGGRSGRDDGILFVLSVGDRRNRLELGYGIESLIPDSKAAAMLEEIKPQLREGNYASACLELVANVGTEVAHITPSSVKIVPRPPTLGERSLATKIVAWLAWLVGVFYHLASARKDKKIAKFRWRFLSRISERNLTLGIWAALPLALLVLFGISSGFGTGGDYLCLWYLAALSGWVSGMVFTAGPIRAVIYGIISISLLVLIAIAEFPEPVQSVWPLGVALFLGLGFLASLFSKKSTGGPSDSSYSSYSSGSYSSSSDSSGSYSSSASSSSSSWSGGGGSSGGGGASSSW